MIKESVKFDEKTVEDIVDHMPIKFKLRLVKKLERQTQRQRWGQLFKIIDKNYKKNPITQEEIDKEIAAVRKRNHAKNRS